MMVLHACNRRVLLTRAYGASSGLVSESDQGTLTCPMEATTRSRSHGCKANHSSSLLGHPRSMYRRNRVSFLKFDLYYLEDHQASNCGRERSACTQRFSRLRRSTSNGQARFCFGLVMLGFLFITSCRSVFDQNSLCSFLLRIFTANIAESIAALGILGTA